ncbi:hypothetical protein ACIRQQ_15840 [Streptomyces fuscichromogenes]|uniref:SbtR family transcriptional regulator n=1 Tax=Streptomyces fuscichromogenes TaxID=1324013 RepID=UPI00380FB83A
MGVPPRPPALRRWPRPSLAASARRFRQALDELLHAAQQAGGVRTDVSADDVAALTVGCATIWAAHRDRSGGTRMVRLALESLRSPAPVTEERVFRDARGTRHASRGAVVRGVRCPARGPVHRPPGPLLRRELPTASASPPHWTGNASLGRDRGAPRPAPCRTVSGHGAGAGSGRPCSR